MPPDVLFRETFAANAMTRKALFGVAGNPPSFFESPFGKERANGPAWLAGLGLDALEVQCTFGVRMPPERAQACRTGAAVAPAC